MKKFRSASDRDQIECRFNVASSNKVGQLIGTKGITIKSICSESGTFINFSKESQIGTVCGTKTSVSKAFELIASKLGEIEDSIRIEIIVPQGQIGRIVGRKGATIRKLEEDSGGKISIQHPINAYQSIAITGSPKAVSSVADYIVNVVEFKLDGFKVVSNPYERKTFSGKRHFFEGAALEPVRPTKRVARHFFEGASMKPIVSIERVANPTDVLECPISLLEAENVSRIIGTSGTTIKNICMQSSTRISFSDVVGTVTGLKKNILKAIELMTVELEKNRDGSLSIAIIIPRGEVPKVIGKGGSTIKKFEQESGATLSIGEGVAIQPIKITGSASQINKAAERIFTCISHFESTGLKRKHFVKRTDDEPSTNIKIMLTEDAVGSIIGKGGEGIKYIARSSGVKISFSRELCYSEGTETGTIVGRVSGIVHALELLSHQIQIYQGLTLIIPNNHVGWILGKNGSRINQTIAVSCAKISISKEITQVAGIEEKIISITGDVSAVIVAASILVKQIGEITE